VCEDDRLATTVIGKGGLGVGGGGSRQRLTIASMPCAEGNDSTCQRQFGVGLRVGGGPDLCMGYEEEETDRN
jgi:hypothetical protein